MRNLLMAFRSFNRYRQNNIIKILSLAMGLAIGLVLISKIYFEQTFDDFYPDHDRIYQIQADVNMNNEAKVFPQVPGAVAPGMKSEIPQVEAATRFTYLTSANSPFYGKDRKQYTAQFIMADSCFFDLLPRPMIEGNTKEILSRPMYVMVSKSVSDKMGGNVVGQTIELDSHPGKGMIIGGVFEDLPHNSHIQYDVVLSLCSIGNFSGDGRDNWIGNDRYIGYVKLARGTDPTSLAPAVKAMRERHQDQERLSKAGVKLDYTFLLLEKLHSDNPSVQRMIKLLAIIAFSLLLTAMLNYVIIVLSTLASRAKEVAIHKYNGASEGNLRQMSFVETIFHVVLSLVLASLLIFLFRNTVEEVLEAPLSAFFTLRTCLVLVGVCVFITLFTGVVPARLFARIPITAVFRNYKKSRRTWMLGLLFVQFAATAFLITLMAIVGKQYNLMVNDNPGYVYENLLHANLQGVEDTDKQLVMDKLGALPNVELVASADCLPFDGQSGNNVSIPGQGKGLFNIADLYGTDPNYFALMQIPIVEGKNFSKENSTNTDVMISQSFATRISQMAGWTDGVVGKSVNISEHYPATIIGVYGDIRIGSIVNADKRPSALFYNPTPRAYILIKMKKMSGDEIQKVYDVFNQVLPNKHVVVTPYKDSMVQQYSSSYRFAKSVMVGAIVTLVIALIGLIGYINNEINRRRSEIAIRKVNGATLTDILRLFIKTVLWIAIPAIVVGEIVSIWVAQTWMEDFSEKAALSPSLFIASGMVLLTIVLLVVVTNCTRAANQNPVETLRNV